MATSKAKSPAETPAPGHRRLSISLPQEQADWLSARKEGPSAAIRALIFEVMSMEKLQQSVRGPAKAKSLPAKKKK